MAFFGILLVAYKKSSIKELAALYQNRNQRKTLDFRCGKHCKTEEEQHLDNQVGVTLQKNKKKNSCSKLFNSRWNAIINLP